MRASLLVVALVAAGCNCGGDDLVRRYETRLEATIPGAEAVVVDSDTLSLRVPGSEAEMLLSVGNLRVECNSNPAQCNDAIDRSARAAKQGLEAMDDAAAPARESVRATLQGPEWMAQVTALGSQVVSTRPFVGDLTVVYVVDLPDSIVNLTPTNRTALGLVDDAALDALALANLRTAITDFTVEPLGLDPRLQLLNIGDSYEGARMLLVDRWAPIAATVQGDLVVSVPTRDNVLFTGSASPESIQALRDVTARVYESEHHPVSKMLFKWSPEGWTVF